MVEVVALVDNSQDALDETCAEFGYAKTVCHASLTAALADVSADILICVTPPQVHREHVTQALQMICTFCVRNRWQARSKIV